MVGTLPYSYSKFWTMFCRLMDESLKGDLVKTQELPHMVVMVSRNQMGHMLAWQFLMKNWDELTQK